MPRTKVQVAVRLEPELLDRLRNAIWHLGKGLTVTGVIEQATEKAVNELESQNGGKPFPPRQGPIPKAQE
jgi:hypothetical protein